MLIGTRTITQGDTRRYMIDYGDFLSKGIKLKAPTASVPTGTTSSVGQVYLDLSETKVILYITGGMLNEVFTVSVQVQDTENETINDTIDFSVVSP